ncbi:MAG: PAS domain S-box protein [Bacteroidetes bacterium]|nr:PAS domain S-box protein [Bacteroidota bacterium]
MGQNYNSDSKSQFKHASGEVTIEPNAPIQKSNGSGEVDQWFQKLMGALETDIIMLEQKPDFSNAYRVTRLIRNNIESKLGDEIRHLSPDQLFPPEIVELIERDENFMGIHTAWVHHHHHALPHGRGFYQLVKTGPGQLMIIFHRIDKVEEIIEGLADGQRNLKQLQENVPIGLFQMDEQGRLLYANPWTRRMLGLNPVGKLQETNLYELVDHKDQLERIRKSVEEDRLIREMEVLLKTNRSESIWCMLSVSSVQRAHSGTITFDGFIYDISERKAVLEQLRDNDGMFRAISDNLKSTLYMFNCESRFTYVNPAVIEITGYSEDELLSMKFYDIVHPDFREVVKERGINRLEGKKAPKRYEFKIITKAGDERWMEIYTTRLFLQNSWVVLGLGNDITNRKQVLEEIKLSEEKYKSLYSFFRLMADNTQDMIWAKDLDKRYIFANKALCESLLMADDTEDPVGKTDFYFAERARKLHPDDPEWYTFGDSSDDTDDIVMQTRQPQQFDEYGNVNGEFLYLDIHKSPLLDHQGRMIGTVGSARNVTFAKRMEVEREKEEKIKNMVYRIGNAVSTTKDMSELITIIRMELSEVIDTTNMFIALYDKNSQEIALPYFVDEKDRFKRIPAGKSLTYYLIRKNAPILLRQADIQDLATKGEVELMGSMAKVWLGVPMIVKGETIGAIVVQNYKDENAFTEHDLELLNFVSIQISISINQKKADDALRENEFTLRQIIDNVPVMIYAKDRDQRFILANKAMASAYGKRVDQVEGFLQSELHHNAAEIDKYMRDDLEVIETGSTKILEEEPFTDAEGHTHVLKTVKLPLKSEVYQGIALLGVSIDITERIQVEQELKKAKNKAEEADRLKTAFLANMSHEIRTPMNAIIGFSELLNDPDLTGDNRKEFVQLIGENSKVLLHLIEDIIDVAKIEAGQIKVVKGACQVNMIMDEIKAQFTAKLNKYPQKKITIRTQKLVPDTRFAIQTDPLRFKQIMNNLVGNAFKFTEEGFIDLGYSIDEKEKTITFFVKDTGIGLEADKLSLIFERFRQAQESSTKEYGGTGLGLTISRRLVEILGGNMWVESVLHEGSTFYFTLPYEAVNVEGFMKPFIPRSDKHDWSGKVILVAEDEVSNFELISATLFKTNAKIVRAVNGKEAVDMINTNQQVDLVLMDIRMPVMNGYEATREIRKMNTTLPIVSLTAYAMSDDIEKSLDAGCNAHISKPFNPRDLLNKLEVYFQKNEDQ